MPKTVTARFETEQQAERALASVAAEVPLRDSAVMSGGVAGLLTLDTLHLTPDERSACEQQLSKGGFLLVAQVATESRGEEVLRLLDGMHRVDEPAPAATPAARAAPAAAPAPIPDRPTAPQQPAPGPEPVANYDVADEPEPQRERAPQPEAEERIPIVNEELRIGKRQVMRGRARVRAFVTDVPVQERVELSHEETHLERRPVNRRISEEELLQGGLLQERVVEIAEMREEAVVTKEAFVREELVVTKSVHRRVEQIDETVRRTQVETERLAPEEEDVVTAR